MATKTETLWDLDVVKAYLGVSSANDDTPITQIADAVSQAIEVRTARKFVTRTGVVKLLDPKGRDRIFLPELDVQQVTLVRTRASFTDTFQTIAAADYELDPEKGVLYSAGVPWPCGPRSAEITYDVGLDVQDGPLLPPDIVGAGLDWCKFTYNRRSAGSTGMQSVSIGGFSMSSIPEPPKDVLAMINAYKRFRGLGQ